MHQFFSQLMNHTSSLSLPHITHPAAWTARSSTDDSAPDADDLPHLTTLFCSQVRHVELVSDDLLFGHGQNKAQAYSNSAREKMARAEVKSAVERGLSPHHLVIVDSANYIKGFRYELYCIARHHSTQHCIVSTCDIPPQESLQWDRERMKHAHGESQSSETSPQGGLYDPQQILDLHARIERPDSKRRWDKPLFVIPAPDARTPLVDLLRVVVSASSKPRPPVSTVPVRLSDTTLLYEMDKMTAEIIRNLGEMKSTAMSGDRVRVCDACPTERVRIPHMKDKHLSPLSLKKLRQQFLKLAQLNPPDRKSVV